MAQSIKLGSNTYLDWSGVTVDNSGTKLSDVAVNTSITPESGWTTDPSITRVLKTGRICQLDLAVGATQMSAGWNNVATLPTGYYPLRTVNGIIALNNANDDSMQAKIDSNNGKIAVYYKASAATNPSIRLHCVYICE